MQHLRYLSILASIAALLLVTSAVGQERITCRNFTYQEEAQAVYEQNPRMNRRLDRDRDGIVCEQLPSQTGARQPTLDDLTPAERRRMGMPQVGASEALLLWMVVGGGLMGAGLVSRRAMRRVG